MSDTKTLTHSDIVKILHSMVDRITKRKNRSVKADPIILKHRLTLWSIAEEFKDYDPEFIAKNLKEMVVEGRITTNMDSGVNYFDAYFIPLAELKNQTYDKTKMVHQTH